MNAKYDLKIDEAIAQITLKIDDEICNTWKIKREDVIKSLKAQQRIDKVIDLITNHHDDLIIISDDGRSVEINFKIIVSILQGEEVKNNEL